MNLKLLASRLHAELDAMDFPSRLDERVIAFSKLVKIPRFQAESILNGTKMPDETLLKHIADELEVTVTWLCGDHETRH